MRVFSIISEVRFFFNNEVRNKAIVTIVILPVSKLCFCILHSNVLWSLMSVGIKTGGQENIKRKTQEVKKLK